MTDEWFDSTVATVLHSQTHVPECLTDILGVLRTAVKDKCGK